MIIIGPAELTQCGWVMNEQTILPDWPGVSRIMNEQTILPDWPGVSRIMNEHDPTGLARCESDHERTDNPSGLA